ncbi:MAG: signal peptidase I [Verrucomicrobia bacterium]|nr:signal peptidase I [Verrucomicrobiota bacterium]
MITKKISAYYTLKKCKRVLRHVYKLYRRKSHLLDAAQKEKVQSLLVSLQTAILKKEPEIASRIAHQLEDTAQKWMPKTLWDKTRDFVGAILFALAIAIVIRSMWFEFYTIPSGSMRPTFKEEDFIVSSKTDYGINVPLNVAHFYFDPTLVERGEVVIFTSENMDVADSDTLYFYLFPGKKQFIKRMIGKPGDLLYFYGGQIYGINARGRELTELRDPKWMQNLEYIPYIRFDGKAKTPDNPIQGVFTPVVFYQMNEPIAKLNMSSVGIVQGEMLPQKNQPAVKHYSDLWGFKNYAMARILKPSEAREAFPREIDDLGAAPLYLEIIHHPSLQGASMVRDDYGRMRPGLHLSRSIIPLSQEKIDLIAAHMITGRFIVKNGIAYRLGLSIKDPTYLNYLPRMSDIPDGTYEIQDGKAYKIGWAGVSKELPKSHPLYRTDPERVQLLYNLGIEFDNSFSPSAKIPNRFPSRYAYFRNQDLYLLGAPIFKKGDPVLTLFLKNEYQKRSMSTSVRPYYPFEDAGPPLKDGKIDIEFLQKYGITVPDKTYLVLGDNHAMSADSRQFGFVPQDNLRGGASLIFWPPGPRWGRPPQAPIRHLTVPNLTVWTLAILIGAASYIIYQRRIRRPLKF